MRALRLSVFAITLLPLFAQGPKVDFVQDVEPLLRKRCSGCHGAQMQTSGLRLDDRDSAMKGGYSGAVIKPGDGANSALIHRVSGSHGLRQMPPAGKKLTADEVAVLRNWIDQGAVWPASAARKAAAVKSALWSLQPINKPAVPKSTRNPIDAFVLARLEREQIQPSPEASKTTLLRRLSFDLTGLPPAPEDVDRFLKDKNPDAYEREVDRLLGSPHFGEKWARHWLDLARYADSDGYEKDWVRPYAWRYRNWVINAFNSDMPFDRFTREQIAGDMLPGASVEQRVATGFHRNTLTNREGGVDNAQFRFENTVDRASTVGTVWLGLTVGCAQCHDHKYDPISQRDFYQMFAFFDNVEELDIDAPLAGEMGPYLRTRSEYEDKRKKLLEEYKVAELQADWEKRILAAADNPGKWTDWDLAWDCVLKLTYGGDGAKILRKPPAERTPRERTILTDHFIRNYHFAVGKKKFDEAKMPELDKKLTELRNSYPQLTQAMTIAEESGVQKSFLRVRGDYKTNGIEVSPEAPSALPGIKKDGRKTRLDLADWLVSAENPLTARVVVNRFWQELFGQGIVKTSEDFGTQGEKPTHPELLDWLAADFRDGGWSTKRLIRTIVTSSTYRQSSDVRKELLSRDPDNKLLARQSRLRLPAESVRDAALQAGGLLATEIGGPSVRPPQPKGVAELGYANSVKWVESTGRERYRRGLYIHFQRTTPYPLLANFDAPKATVTQCRRGRSNTPLQALNLLNDPVFLESAQALAYRSLQESKPAFDDRVRQIYRHALARDAQAPEIERLKKYFDQQKAILDREPKSLDSLLPMTPPIESKLEAGAWIALSSVVLNLDEFIVRE